MKTATRIAIVVPVFNRFQFLPRLLKSLSRHDLDVHFIIVDHGSKNLSLQNLGGEDFKNVGCEILKRSPKLWFTGAANEGLRHLQSQASFTHGLLINDDVIIEDPLWWDKMLARSTENHLVSCMAVSEDKRTHYSSLKLNRLKFNYTHVDQGRKMSEIPPAAWNCDVLPTRGLLFRPEQLAKIGLMAEKELPHYASDYEWTARAKALGFQLLMTSETYLVTEMKESSKEVSGRRKYKGRDPKAFWSDLFNPHLQGNMITTSNYAKLVFQSPYRQAFVSFRFLKKTLGFVKTNYWNSGS